MNYPIPNENIFSQVTCSSKKKALELISQRAAEVISEQTQLFIDEQQIFEALFVREKMGCTHIGQGVALPHCQLEYDFSPCIIVMQLKQSIDFDCIDEAEVSLIFAIILPQEGIDQHRLYFEHLQTKFSDKPWLKSLKSATTPEQIAQLVAEI